MLMLTLMLVLLVGTRAETQTALREITVEVGRGDAWMAAAASSAAPPAPPTAAAEAAKAAKAAKESYKAVAAQVMALRW